MNRLKVARSAVTASVVLLGALAAFGESTQPAPAVKGKSQLTFGVDMAKRGLWSEALFRFEQARRLEPERISILNNLAICYEADGRFEDALATYREALRLAPENRVVKQNYSRFAEFYQGYRPRKATPPAAGGTPVPATPPASPNTAGVDGATPPAAAEPAAAPPTKPEAAPPAEPAAAPPASSPPPPPPSGLLPGGGK